MYKEKPIPMDEPASSGADHAAILFQRAEEKINTDSELNEREVVNLFEQSGDLYEERKHLDRAIEAFDKAVSQIENLESPRRHDQFRKTSILQKKAQCLMRRKRFAEAEQLYETTVIPFIREERTFYGKYGNSKGKIYEVLAEKRVPEAMCAHSAYVQELDKAIEYVQKADKEYEEENNVSGRRRMKARVGELLVHRALRVNNAEAVNDFLAAMEAYHDCAKVCNDDRLLRFGASSYYIYSIFCGLAAGDIVAADDLLSECARKILSFENSREEDICRRLISGAETNPSVFREAVEEYKDITELCESSLAESLLNRANEHVTIGLDDMGQVDPLPSEIAQTEPQTVDEFL